MTPPDDVFRLLAPERRRFALYYLERAEGPVPVEELAEQVAEWEADPSATDLPDAEHEEVQLTLRHQHLPKAAEAEFVEYDREAGVVRLTGAPQEFRVILAVARAVESPSTPDDPVDLHDLI